MAGGLQNLSIGAVAELEAALQFTKMGYEIYFPQLSQSKADFIAVSPEGVCNKIQVKKATENPTGSGTYLQVRIQGKPGNYSTREYVDGDFDYLVAVHELGMWSIPWECVKDLKSLTFGKVVDGEFKSRSRGFTVDGFKIK